MKIHHIAIWTFRLEELREFYIRYFNGTSNEKYINPKKGFESYFIYFDDGAALELMSRTDVQNTPIEENKLGLTHFALSFQSKEDVLRTTEQLRSEGYTIAGEPRTSGDGEWKTLSNIQLCGLMGMATNTDDNEQIEKEFCSLSSFFKEVKDSWFADTEAFRELSMGMSHDYHQAIAAGSTLIRVGSKIFGDRTY